MNSAIIFCTCLLKTWLLVINLDRGSCLPGGVKSKRSQLILCKGSVIGRPLIGEKYEWLDVGKSLLRLVLKFYFLVQRLK